MKEKDRIVLKVAEASINDVGRGIARIDPSDMNALGIETGDVIEIREESKQKGKRTVAKVLPAKPEDRGASLLKIDGITRSNAGVTLGDKAGIEKTVVKPAEKVVFEPVGSNPAAGVEYVRSALNGLALVEGDVVSVGTFGAQDQLLAAGVRPQGSSCAVIIQPTTAIEITGSKQPGSRKILSYEDVGGLQNELRKIREMIELPLRHPEIVRQLGIEPPKGVLLYGPPGTGKTLIAKAVASETDAYFTSISGPEIVTKWVGESEGRLREIFQDAQKNAPSIIFIDELDAIAPKRENATGEVERRVVAQLLASMDGLEAREKVVVLGATNRPNSLDPALRRPGRFDREIMIGVPDRNGRLQILQIHTRGMPINAEVNLERLADVTPGFVGADLAALCKEAAMRTLRRVLPDIDVNSERIPQEALAKLRVKMSDFEEALREVEPSAMREVMVEVPNVRWADIGGLEKAKQELVETIEWPLRYPDIFGRARLRPSKGILLYGPPGTGKTLLAKAVATESGVNFISIKGPELLSKFVGESEKGIRETFRRARQVAPCVLFFDEIDSLVPRKGGGIVDGHVAERVVSQFLTEMDGIESLKGVTVLAATNRPELIESAMLRPGRFDRIIRLCMPDEASRKKIFEVHAKEKPLDNVDFENLAKETEGMSGADIESICRTASLLAIKELVSDGKGKNAGGFTITGKHFTDALNEFRNGLVASESESKEKEDSNEMYRR